MVAPDLGRWDPLPIGDAVEQFREAPFRWWVSGGCALEIHLGRTWRSHEDTDIGVGRDDISGLTQALHGWDIHVAAGGKLTRWDGGPLDPTRHQNNLWCRPTPADPWSLDVTVGDGDDERWIYRRDRTVTQPWAEAVLTSDDGVPYLAPELQLLFKSREVRPKDDVDAREVIPELSSARQSRLAELLPADHPWQRLMRECP